LHTVFLIASGIYLSGATCYGVFASGQLQNWARNRTTSALHDNDNDSDSETVSFLKSTDF